MGQDSEPGARHWRVLVVDDHADSASALARLLRQQGHDVTQAGSVRDALALTAAAAARGPFHLLISDLGLPDGSGCALLQSIAHSQWIRGIALTGYTDDQTASSARAAGFSRFLSKPVSFPDLLLAIRDVMTIPDATRNATAGAGAPPLPRPNTSPRST